MKKGTSGCSLLHLTLVKLRLVLLRNRAGELSAAELEQLMVIVANPRTFKIPDWFLNRQKDFKDGRNSQLTSSALDTKLREDLERLKKIRCRTFVTAKASTTLFCSASSMPSTLYS